MGLCVLYPGPEKDRADTGGASAGWTGGGGVRDGVGERSGNRRCARGGSPGMEGHVGGRDAAREEGEVPRKGAVREEPAPERNGQCEGRVSVGEDSGRMRRHVGQRERAVVQAQAVSS